MLRLRLLGELEVWRDDARLALPPSRKTRALLGYLAATGRTHRRERLCTMFWEIPDDPRGSLRWSMSRLRPLVDEAAATRIVANRESVGFDPAGADVDLLTLREAAARGFDSLETPDLQSLAQLHRGEFLEGLELPVQHEFQAWCLAEREDQRQQQIRLLGVLAERLRERPAEQLAPLRQLVQIEPYAEDLRLDFLRALLAAGRENEAERQFETAERLFRELGGDAAARLTRQWRSMHARRTPATSAAPEATPPPQDAVVVPAVRTVTVEESVGSRLVGGSATETLVAQGALVPSLAVLPFANLGSDPEQEYFADGVVEEIITALSRFKSFAVVARNSSFAYKGRAIDVRQVASDLGVRYAVEGSIRRAGDRLRISARLVDTDSGAHLWAEVFEGVTSDIFAFQDRITESVAGLMEPGIQAAEIERTRRRPTDQLDAYGLYLQAKSAWYAAQPDGYTHAFDLLQRAVSLAPDYAPALAMAASLLEAHLVLGWPPLTDDDRQGCLDLAERALASAGGDPQILGRVGSIFISVGRDSSRGLRMVRDAINANPNDVYLAMAAAVCELHVGDLDAALEMAHRAMRLSPADRGAHWPMTTIAHIHMAKGDYDEALAWAEQAYGRNPKYDATHWMLIAANAQLGRTEQTREWLDRYLAFRPGATVARILAGQSDALPERIASIIEGLEKAGLARGTPQAPAGSGAPETTIPPQAAVVVPAVRTVTRHTAMRSPLGRTPFVGRRGERRRLAAAIGAATKLGEVGVTLILGEPGMGKSRLILEASAQAENDGVRVFMGRAFDGGLTAAYAPWTDALGGLPEVIAEDGLSAGRERLFAAVIASVRGDGASPTLVALDDMHWSDEASADLLHQLVRAARGTPLSILIGARPGDLADNSAMSTVLRSLRAEGLVDEVRLAPLDASEIGELAAALAPEDRVERIVGLSGGNPLFATELARDIDADTDALPSSLRELLRERLDRLPSASAELLRWGAVIGTSFRAPLLRAVAALGSTQFLQALDLMERHDMFRPASDDTYAFSHDLVRHAVLSTISSPRRKLMHLRVAEVLAEEAGDERIALDLATHAAEAGDYAMAARACATAGRRALRVFAHVEAMALVRAGRHHAAQLRSAERIERLVELAEVELSAERDPDGPGQIAALSELAEEALDAGRPELASRCYTMLAHLRWRGGEWQGAQRDTLQAEFVSRLTGTEERAVAMAEAARCLAMLERDLEHAEALALEAEALARRVPIEPNAIPDALGLLRAHQGSFAEAEQLFARAREIARRDGDRLNEYLVLEHHVMLTLASGQLSPELSEELVALAEKIRPGSELAFAEALRAICGVRAARAGAASDLAAALERLRSADAKHRLAVAATAAARAALEAGQNAQALQLAEEALDNAEKLDRASDMAEALATIVEIECRSASAGTSHADRLVAMSGAALSASARAASARALGAVSEAR